MNEDRTPLAGMPLTGITLPPDVKRIEVLRDIKTLTNFNNLPSVQLWKLWDATKSKAK